MARSPRKPIVLNPDGQPSKVPVIWISTIFFLLFLFITFAPMLASVYTDWLWFKEVGYTVIFQVELVTKTLMFFMGAALFFTIFYSSTRIALNNTKDKLVNIAPQYPDLDKRIVGVAKWVLLLVGIFLAFWAGRVCAENWARLLEFQNGVAFGETDPIFKHDIGFYIFQLPFLRDIQAFLLASVGVAVAASLLIYVGGQTVKTLSGFRTADYPVRAHLLGLYALFALLLAFGTYLYAYTILQMDNGKFHGAGYVDVGLRLFSVRLGVVLLVLVAVTCIYSIIRKGGFQIPVVLTIVWLLTAGLGGAVLPGMVQRFYVQPNEFKVQESYIDHNLTYTRKAFGLDKVRVINNFPADISLDKAGLERNQYALENVRLWDYGFLGKVYGQLQSIKNYYRFEKTAVNGVRKNNVDVDRYTINGRIRQVMLGAREMDIQGLPETAQTWQNMRQTYTHGYGVVMSPVDRVADGLPEYFVSGIPLKISPSTPELKVTRPGIYYGELGHHPVIVNSDQPEFDYPSTAGTGKDQYTRYNGKAGIPIGQDYFARLAFASKLGDVNLLLASAISKDTKFLYRRDIRDRVQTILPFIQQDTDPYLVIDTATGHLVWLMDGYTLSSEYPYSTPQNMSISESSWIAPNYIRNSVKITVDAYEGTVQCYIADDKDPIIRTYAKIFPGVLKPIREMPETLRSHVRFPEDIFRLQRLVYAKYHVDDPRTFYSQDDSWAIPVEPNMEPSSSRGTRQSHQVEPYYVVLRLPGVSEGKDASKNLEFVLMSPFAPVKREDKNILGWMCARCDGDNYGELILYRFGQQTTVNGPSQTLAYINNDPIISPQLTPLRLAGSTANFGNLIIVPIESSILTIAPLFVESTSGTTGLPKLEKVAVAFGDRVAMADSLQEALAQLFIGNKTTSTTRKTETGSSQGSVPASIPVLIDRAVKDYEEAQAKLKAGDWAGYGEAMKQLENNLRQAQKLKSP